LAASDDRAAHPGLRRPRSVREAENLGDGQAKTTRLDRRGRGGWRVSGSEVGPSARERESPESVLLASADDDPKPLSLCCRQVGRLRVRHVRKVCLAPTAGMFLFVSQTARRDRLQDVDHQRVSAETLCQHRETIPPDPSAVAAGEADDDIGEVAKAEVSAHRTECEHHARRQAFVWAKPMSSRHATFATMRNASSWRGLDRQRFKRRAAGQRPCYPSLRERDGVQQAGPTELEQPLSACSGRVLRFLVLAWRAGLRNEVFGEPVDDVRLASRKNRARTASSDAVSSGGNCDAPYPEG